MANTAAPFGLRPWGCLLRVRPYYLPSTYGTAMFIGDPVVLTGTSNTAQAFGFPIGTLPEVNKVTFGATNKCVGVIVGFNALPSNLEAQYNPASTARIAYVADHPNQEFVCQDDGAGTMAAADVGLNTIFVTGSGSTVTGLSGVTVSGTTKLADGTYQAKIIGFAPMIDNDATSDYASLIVRINLHQYVDANAGV